MTFISRRFEVLKNKKNKKEKENKREKFVF